MFFGGGGAGGALVPFIANKLNYKYKICKDAHVISTIGVSLSTVREVIEKTVFNPTKDDIENLKTQAISKIKNSTSSIDTYVEFDKTKNILRVVATGSTKNPSPVSQLELIKIIANHVSCPESLILMDKQIGKYFIFNTTLTTKIIGFIHKKKKLHIVIDSFGIIRFIKSIRKLYFCSNSNIVDILKKNSTYSDVGQLFPNCKIVTPSKIINAPNISDTSKILSFVKSEVDLSNTFDVAILIE